MGIDSKLWLETLNSSPAQKFTPFVTHCNYQAGMNLIDVASRIMQWRSQPMH